MKERERKRGKVRRQMRDLRGEEGDTDAKLRKGIMSLYAKLLWSFWSVGAKSEAYVSKVRCLRKCNGYKLQKHLLLSSGDCRRVLNLPK